MTTDKDKTIRDSLADFLGMLAHKARTGELTADDAAVLYQAIRDAGGIRATVKALAGISGPSALINPLEEKKAQEEAGADNRASEEKQS